MPAKARFEYKTFIFIPGKLRPTDYITMRKQGWYVVAKQISPKGQEPKLITLYFERRLDQ